MNITRSVKIVIMRLTITNQKHTKKHVLQSTDNAKGHVSIFSLLVVVAVANTSGFTFANAGLC
jgi:hypothetical protein